MTSPNTPHEPDHIEHPRLPDRLAMERRALFWAGHLRKFRHVRAIDGTLLRLNLLHLIFIGAMPFCTALLSETGAGLSVVICAVVQCMATTSSGLMWSWAERHPVLLQPGVGEIERRIERRIRGVAVAMFGLSIPLAFRVPSWALLSWILLAPGLRWARKPRALPHWPSAHRALQSHELRHLGL